ncbi:hypothetical protein ETAA8_28770 [Anatilimnocola aggregata]|uniref:SLA1 homology domain-containing protein n=1 Tax=Anatilimnocola aggregata TaxID=2528021 RepID=A0A517YC07_9BACT|nr:SHD1 domain-containing protein [Anatilimnocola aggregata]QDU27786.1 hypothetical protein ETAA8_28770 [Anatilimnocola aggregata]
MGYPYGQPGSDPFAPGPGPQRSGLNLKVPLLISGIILGLVLLFVAGVIALGVGAFALLKSAEKQKVEPGAEAFADYLKKQQALPPGEREIFGRTNRPYKFVSVTVKPFVPPEAPPPSLPSTQPSPPPSFQPVTPSFQPAPTPNFQPAPVPSFEPAPSFQPVAPSFTPVPIPQPGANPVAGGNEENAPPPGFPATDVSQFKPRDLVYVFSDKKWYPAVVMLKRGILTRIRYSTNGVMEVVSLDRIRLEKDPHVQVAASGLPSALKPLTPKPGETKESGESEDDSLFVAKPSDERLEPTTSTPAANPAIPAALKPVSEAKIREWTDATGQHKIKAELIDFEFDHVQLRRTDGKVINMPISMLCADDQAIVREKYP